MIWGKLFPRWGRKDGTAATTLRLDKRRGPRVCAHMRVFVYGRTQGEPFSEHTETTNVSPQGGLLVLSTKIERAQPLLLTNLQTEQDLACRVTRVTKTDQGKTLVGLEFLHPAPDFWSIDFSSRPFS